MHSAAADTRTKRSLNISSVAPKCGLTILGAGAGAIRGALTTAVLSALLLMGARAAQGQRGAVLYSFCPDGGLCTDGYGPQSLLTSDGAGNLYGTTPYGGAWGYGTVFELSPDGSGGWIETVIYSLCAEGGANCTDGGSPGSYVIFDGAGNLYGTAASGGAEGKGVVFELSPVGSNWTESVLYSFCSKSGCADGENPSYGLLFDSAGNLYGTNSGGAFELSPSGGSWTEQLIYYAFGSTAGLTMNAAGTIFGVTYAEVYELSPNGDGSWTGTVIYNFRRASRNSSPVVYHDGSLYGTLTIFGRHVHSGGWVFRLGPGKKGPWTEKTLYKFSSDGVDGFDPTGSLVFDAAGNIYGITQGGTNAGATVYELLAPVGKNKKYVEKVLLNLTGPYGDEPGGGLILVEGSLYGTAAGGGAYNRGVVFEVTP